MNRPDPLAELKNLALDEEGFVGGLTIGTSIALVAVIVILGAGVVIYGHVPLPEFPQFVPLHVAFVFLFDAITAFLLFGQFHYRRLLLYLLLGSGYLFNAMVSLPFLLTFPGGLQSEGGVIGGPQSAIWLWHYWHIFFPVIVAAALVMHGVTKGHPLLQPRLWPLSLLAFGLVLITVVALTLSVTFGHDWLPVLIDVTDKPRLTIAFYWAGAVAAATSFIALALTCFYGRCRITLNLWLAVAMTAFLADVIASLNADARYTVGWYFGRIEAIIAAGILLMVFLSEVFRLYQQLYTANTRLVSLVEENLRAQKDLESKNRELEFLSRTDYLTQIANRQVIEHEIGHMIQNARRYDRPFSLIVLDIDHFKYINDQYGHNVGDEVLRTLARVINKRLRATDVVGRWGGEEFLITCAETDLNDAAALAEVLRSLIEEIPFPLPSPVTASFGVAQYQMGDGIESLVARADGKLYLAKRNGRNQVVAAESVSQTESQDAHLL